MNNPPSPALPPQGGQGSRVRELLVWAVQQLIVSESARADAEILLAHCLQKPRTWLFTWPEKEVDPAIRAEFQRLLAERARGVPVAYLTGQREFWTLNLKVTPDTLIPRPETELLVETALSLLPAPLAGEGLGMGGKGAALDLGTGTGAIALALATERPDLPITAIDFSPAALAVAAENARTHAIHNVQFILSDWFSALPPQRFHLIISNPPYIEAQDPHLNQGDVRFEPSTALASGVDGLDDIRHLVQTAPQWLENGGWLLLEHGYNQGKAVTALLQAAGFQQVRCLPDLAGNERVSLGQYLD
ncbi:MAG TPA: peptide chain release factor N(5)-glutamine methyltransferase [Candidatus Thiothrix moscowensis]|uniref:peptide chain release factor N(5)-glutamine methyltransferase n=1 Tax=unclassified Thiothrix TaxID=2636184 RepID=UPI0025F2550B|nr:MULTISPECIES: peptide chain release factor N(5)-glutamine methyltransferase [unclassified Thiothrix]HRJ53305.1 peptide chain release factor N(5)-glutamine methyltransferase [Candidatus Thiothrix moscowensis]HRJ94144.1 peptide chain release factor N(5)-glutamine methyltransferase [Candidatus Thiothrix moscowensis]